MINSYSHFKNEAFWINWKGNRVLEKYLGGGCKFYSLKESSLIQRKVKKHTYFSLSEFNYQHIVILIIFWVSIPTEVEICISNRTLKQGTSTVYHAVPVLSFRILLSLSLFTGTAVQYWPNSQKGNF